MQTTISKRDQRNTRRVRVRSRVSGTSVCPRLNVFRSLKGVFTQLIDDEAGKTLVGASFKEVDAKSKDAGERTGKVKVAYLVGKLLAEKAQAKKITKAVFDRAGYRYHGRVQAVADGARDGGLKF